MTRIKWAIMGLLLIIGTALGFISRGWFATKTTDRIRYIEDLKRDPTERTRKRHERYKQQIEKDVEEAPMGELIEDFVTIMEILDHEKKDA